MDGWMDNSEREREMYLEMICGEQNTNKGFCSLMFWRSCAEVPAVVLLRGPEKKITLTF